jgi:uncharacterized protein
MSQENVELMRGVYERLARGDFWALAPLLHDEVEWEWDPRYARLTGGSRVYRGPDEVEMTTREWLSAWKWFRIEPEGFIDAGESVVVLARYHARPRHGGPEIEDQATEVWTLRDGKVVRFRSYRDRAEGLEAAGLSDDAAG